MYAICIESSHQRGMGHLFRALNMIRFLNERRHPYLVILNNDATAIRILESKQVPFVVADLRDTHSDWESGLIAQFGIKAWINDRLNTEYEHSINVVRNKIKLVTFDDKGSGASLADVHVAALINDNKNALGGKHLLNGPQYLILNPDIARYRKQRQRADRILVTLGGSDTHFVTEKIMDILRSLDRKATIVLGPSSKTRTQVETDEWFTIKRNVPSLAAEFFDHDIAITGGGITPFEANASGLPCFIVSNEIHEIETALMLQAIGSSVYVGHHNRILPSDFTFDADVEQLSRCGLERVGTNGIEKVFEAIMI